MTKPDAAGTRSLEEILASIRKSLADETVDGLVELSAAAAAAVRAEAKPLSPVRHAAVEQERRDDDRLSEKLAGALSETGNGGYDLADLLAEPKLPSLSIPRDAPRDATPATSEAKPAGDGKDPMWFLRPGAPEEPQKASGQAAAPVLKIDPFAAGRGGSDYGAAAGAKPDLSSGDPPASTAREPGKLPVPRLDAEKISFINKLKANGAAPAEPADKPAAAVDLRKSDLPAPQPSVAAPTAPAAAPAPVAEPAEQPASEQTILTRPEMIRASLPPLFGGATDNRKPVVSAARPSAPADVEKAEPVAKAEDLSVEDILQPVAEARIENGALYDEPADVEAVEEVAANGRASLALDLDAILAAPDVAVKPAAVAREAPAIQPTPAAAPIPPPVESTPPAAGPARSDANRPLEDMIAAVLEPVLQKLLEKNLAPMLEVMVRREVEKALKKTGHR